MATVGIKIFKHHKKNDGTYNVKVRITHKGINHYLDTAQGLLFTFNSAS